MIRRSGRSGVAGFAVARELFLQRADFRVERALLLDLRLHGTAGILITQSRVFVRTRTGSKQQCGKRRRERADGALSKPGGKHVPK